MGRQVKLRKETLRNFHVMPLYKTYLFNVDRLFGFFMMILDRSGLLCGALGSASVPADKEGAQPHPCRVARFSK